MSTNIVESRDPERERRKQQEAEQQAALVRSRLVQKLLQPNPDIRQYLHDLVYTQAVVIAGTEAAAFLLHVKDGSNEGQLENVAHIRPDTSSEEVRTQALKAFSEIIANCINDGRDGVIEVGATMDLTVEPQYCLVTLLRADNRVVAATAVITRCRDNARAQQRLDVMQVVAGYFDYYMLRRGTEQIRMQAQNHQDVLQYATAVGTSDGFKQAVANLCNELAARTGAVRVSLGWVQGMQKEHPIVKLKGLSHTEEFDKKQELSVQLRKVMEECLDQDEIVQFDPADQNNNTANVTREAALLSRMEGSSRVLSLPLRRKNLQQQLVETCGVVTLEFPDTKKPSDQETTAMAVTAELMGPILWDRFQNHRWITTKIALFARDQWMNLVGPRYWLAKLVVLLGISLFAFLIFYQPMHHVRAPFSFISPPNTAAMVEAGIDGVIEQIHVQPGDRVEAGQVLLEFDDTLFNARYEEARWNVQQAEAEFLKLSTETQNGQNRLADALAKQKEIEALKLKLVQARTELSYTKVVSPIAGTVTMGDLKFKVSAPVQRGEKLFEVAQIDQLRVEISVPERDVELINDLSSGKPSVGTIRTAARPDITIPISVERLVPQGQTRNNANVLTAYATIDASKIDPTIRNTWRPGMAGEAAIDNAPRSLLWQWSERLIEWVRLQLWI